MNKTLIATIFAAGAVLMMVPTVSAKELCIETTIKGVPLENPICEFEPLVEGNNGFVPPVIVPTPTPVVPTPTPVDPINPIDPVDPICEVIPGAPIYEEQIVDYEDGAPIYGDGAPIYERQMTYKTINTPWGSITVPAGYENVLVGYEQIIVGYEQVPVYGQVQVGTEPDTEVCTDPV